MPFFTYILQNPEGRFYIGQTSDLTPRLQRHNEGQVRWTSQHRPWTLVWNYEYETRSEAMAEEKRLKALHSRSALQDFIGRS